MEFRKEVNVEISIFIVREFSLNLGRTINHFPN